MTHHAGRRGNYMLLERERSAAATGDGSRFCDRREAISLALLAVLIGYFPVHFGGKKRDLLV